MERKELEATLESLRLLADGLSEEQIERRVESMVDRLDARYMADEINGEEYRARMDEIRRWVDALRESPRD